MHTDVFGRYNGPEEIMSENPNLTEINITENYAPTASVKVQIADKDGNPVADACVEFKIYNYGEFHTVGTKYTGTDGTCSLSAGLGDMLVWASKDGRFGFAKVSFGKQQELTVKLDKQEGDLFAEDIDIVPPVENANLPEVTPGQRAENDCRMAQEDSIRNAYTATFFHADKANEFVATLSGLKPAEARLAAKYLVQSCGNHETLTRFLTMASNDGKASLAVSLLGVISAKDLRDVAYDVLVDNLTNTPDVQTDRYVEDLLSPRVSIEGLVPYKAYFQTNINGNLAETFRLQPQRLVEWCKDSIAIHDELNTQGMPMSPIGVWKARVADRHSRDVFFVSVARSLGIPAWKDAVTGKVRYQDLANRDGKKGGIIYDVDFEQGSAQEVPPTGQLTASYKPTPVLDDPSTIRTSLCPSAWMAVSSCRTTMRTRPYGPLC